MISIGILLSLRHFKILIHKSINNQHNWRPHLEPRQNFVGTVLICLKPSDVTSQQQKVLEDAINAHSVSWPLVWDIGPYLIFASLFHGFQLSQSFWSMTPWHLCKIMQTPSYCTELFLIVLICLTSNRGNGGHASSDLAFLNYFLHLVDSLYLVCWERQMTSKRDMF